MSWQQLTLQDIAVLHYGKSLPERVRSEGEFPVYGSGGMVGSHREALVKGPGIVVGRKGTVGAIYWENRDFFPIDTVYYAEPVHDEIDKKWLYYQLKRLPLASMNSDAAVPGLNRGNAYSVKVQVPDLDTQCSIASVLSAYDDLIENNRRRIALLEEAARLLYREWFVHLRFPGHEHTKIIDGVPEGWERMTLGDHCPFNYGKALTAETRVDGDVDVFGSSGIVGSHNQKLVDGPAIIVGRKGNVGSIFWAYKAFWPIDTVYYIAPEASDLFTYFALKNTQFISTDVAVPGLNRNYAHSRQILIPDASLLADFLEYVAPMHEQCRLLERAARELAKVRDLLLPRLMDGRIAV